MNHLVLPTLSEILINEGMVGDRMASGRLRAQQQWYGAIRGLNQLLDRFSQEQKSPRDGSTASENPTRSIADIPPPDTRGYVISGPSPVLMTSALAAHFTTQILTCESQFGSVGSAWGRERGFRLLPASDGEKGPAASVETIPEPLRPSAFPLSEDDPLTREPFCLVLTAQFSLVMVLGVDETDNPAFLFSFDPDTVTQALQVLRDRMVGRSSTSPRHLHHQIAQLDAIAAQFPPVEPHYRTVTEFSRLLLHNLPPEDDRRESKPKSPVSEAVVTPPTEGLFDAEGHFIAADRTIHKSQVELLQAIAHEVRTPLTTIRTFTRLLLKRQKFDPEVVHKRLEAIDRECTSQIDRFNLIFRAVELEMSQVRQRSCPVPTSPGVQLTTMSLGDVFQSGLPRWQKQASQRNHTLEVILPKQLPAVVSDPTLLDQMLTGAIENFTRSLPSGSHIHVGVRLAGHLLKLQLESHPEGESNSPFCGAPKSPLKSIGPLLMVQPETGSLSLNMNVTKNLFQALGGKLVMRQRPQQGKVMTIFLPVQVSSVEEK